MELVQSERPNSTDSNVPIWDYNVYDEMGGVIMVSLFGRPLNEHVLRLNLNSWLCIFDVRLYQYTDYRTGQLRDRHLSGIASTKVFQ